MSGKINSEMGMKRRNFLKGGIATGVASIGTLAIGDRALGACSVTPQQTMGPFYPVADQADKNWDLTQVDGVSQVAIGEQFYLNGRILDEHCVPVAGALVEIWQACESGKYNHPGDPTDLPLDPNFQYWGQVLTGDDGTYFFKTIVPGDYPATPTWQRPPHVHIRVRRRGFRELVTQMYFEGHPLNDSDRILQELSAEEREQVVVPLVPAPSGRDDQTPGCLFDMTITSI